MFEKNLRFAYLLDYYGPVLDQHTEAVMKAYYDDDLSLAEVASGVGISRQGVRHIIKKGEDRLEFLEEKLGLMKRESELSSALDLLESLLSSPDISDRPEALARLSELRDIISPKN